MTLAGGTDAAYRARVGRGGGRWCHRVEVWRSGERIDTFGDDGLPLDSGSVAVTLNNRVTRRLSATVPAELYPFDTGDLLSPLGAQLRVYAGWRFGSLPVDWFPVFVGPVMSVGPISPRSDGFDLSATDLAEGIIADEFIVSQVPNVGDLATAEFRRLIAGTYSGASFGRFDEQYTVVPEMTWTSDRAGACDSLAKAASCMWFFDATGSATWRRIPWTYPSFDTVDLTLAEGSGLLDLSVKDSRDGVYNVIVVNGETANAEAPVHAYAMDLDPDSPTYVNGSLGSRVMKISEDLATTEQAQSLAKQRLTRSRAVSRDIRAEVVADPCLEMCDVIDMSLEGWTIRAALTSYTIALTGGNPTMSCTFREAGGMIDGE